MRKTLLSPLGNSSAAAGHDWLDLEQAGRVEVSSEAEGYPVEGALLKDVRGGWRELGLSALTSELPNLNA